MSTGDTALELRALSVGHGTRSIVRGIDLSVSSGEVVVLVGPNGTGKTTVLRTVAGQLAPRDGEVIVGGRPLGSLTPDERARQMAALFTDRPRTDLLTCKDIVDAGRYPYTGALGMLTGEDERRVRSIMEATGTWQLRSRDFAHMSDGQRQRALIARALVQEPSVLLLDEPTSFLDIRAQVAMLSLVRDQARRRGIAVLATLHDIALAERVADRVVCIRDGRIMGQGAPEQIFRAETVADLYGIDPASFVPEFGTVELGRPEGDPEVFVVAGGGTGAACFRALQRAGVPFATGVLHEGDVDCILARGLAARTITEPAFAPISGAALEEAFAAVASCRALICCPDGFGEGNARNAELVARAQEAGKPIYRDAPSFLEERSPRR